MVRPQLSYFMPCSYSDLPEQSQTYFETSSQSFRCDNATAFVSSGKPLLALPENGKDPFESFEDPELNQFLTGPETGEEYSMSPLWSLALNRILSDELIAAFRSLHTITALLDTSPSLSEHDMLVYDRKRASIQHQLADVAIPPITHNLYHISESCRLAAILYSNFALWGFKPPMDLYGHLAKMLQKALQATDDVCQWGPWSDMLLWTLFIGGYAAFGRQERAWFSMMIREEIRSQKLKNWRSARDALDTMPVCQALWVPFETLWWEATLVVLEGDATGDGGQVLSIL